jgi:hypothetical protein
MAVPPIGVPESCMNETLTKAMTPDEEGKGEVDVDVDLHAAANSTHHDGGVRVCMCGQLLRCAVM